MSSIVQNPTGVYTITFNSAHPSNNNYLIFGTISGNTGAVGYITCVNNANNQIEVRTYNTSNGLTSYAFNFVQYHKLSR